MSTARAVPQLQPKRELSAGIKAVSELHHRYAAAFNSNDAAAVATFYTEEAVLMLPGIPAIQGRQAIQAMFEEYFKQNAVKIKHTPLDTQVVGDWAYERGNIREAITPRSGQPLEKSLKYLAILKRQADGAWKIHVDIVNSNQ